MRLICVSNYRNGTDAFIKGAILDVSDSVGEFLLRDSPGSFRVEAEAKPEKVEGVNRQQRGGHVR